MDTSLSNSSGTSLGVYTLSYSAASSGQTLTVTYTQNNATTGNVTLQAATLIDGVPSPDFAISATPATQVVAPGGNTAYTVTIDPLRGFSSTVQFNVAGLPSGTTASFSPASIVGAGSSTLTVTAGSGTAAGTYPLTITGTSGSLSHTAGVTLTVTSPGGGGALAGSVSAPAGTQQLNSLGTADWAHWGLTTASSYDHKAGVTPQISNYAVVGSVPASRYTNNPIAFAWTGGTPTASATTATGVYISGQNNGFQISVPADTSIRTLTVFVGLWNAQGKMVAHLSDGSAPDYVDTSLINSSGVTLGVYTFTYTAAASGQTLTITYTQNNATGGNVTLQAATLSP